MFGVQEEAKEELYGAVGGLEVGGSAFSQGNAGNKHRLVRDIA